jgi:hypothetical protein
MKPVKTASAIVMLWLLGSAALAEENVTFRKPRFLASGGTPFAPRWNKFDAGARQVGRPYSTSSLSTNTHATGGSNHVFFPLAGTYLYSRLARQPQLVVAGWERDAIVVKAYQRQTGRHSYLPLDSQLTVRGRDPVNLQGAGAWGKHLIIAGGTTKGRGSLEPGSRAHDGIFLVNGETLRTRALPKLPRAVISPIIGGAGRYLFVAGGVDKTNRAIKTIQILDMKKRKWLDSEQVEARFPGLSSLPTSRVGGGVAYVNDKKTGKKLLVFAGGSETWIDRAPTRKVDIYDIGAKRWETTESSYARMFPAVAVRHTKQGPEVVIAGGGTGPIGSSARIDPQIQAVEMLNVRKNRWHHGDHLPIQRAIMTGHGRGSPTAWTEWGGNVLTFINRYTWNKIVDMSTRIKQRTTLSGQSRPTTTTSIVQRVRCRSNTTAESLGCVLVGFDKTFIGDLRPPQDRHAPDTL